MGFFFFLAQADTEPDETGPTQRSHTLITLAKTKLIWLHLTLILDIYQTVLTEEPEPQTASVVMNLVLINRCL